ncbi:hypothetical protein KAH55_15260, partial [bacterium]|nr:hypothetical protein [bacterium]
RMAHYANQKKARITIVDRIAQSRYAAFEQRYPAIKEICDINCVEMDADNPNVLRLLEMAADIPEAIVSIALCFQNFIQNLVKGLDISHHLKNNEIPIFIRSTNEFEDENLLGRYQHNFIMYGKYSDIGGSERLFRHKLDQLAMVNHAQFIAHRKADETFGTGEADQPWDLLDPKYKNSNRQAADHIEVKLRAIGCQAVKKQDAEAQHQPGLIAFEADEIEIMAMMEHERWVAERLLGGWMPGTDKPRRRSPFLVSWEKLDEIDVNIKSYDRGSVQEIPEILARDGKVVVRET